MGSPRKGYASPALARAIQQSCDAIRVIGETQSGRGGILGEPIEVLRIIKDLLWEIRFLVEAGEREFGEGIILRGKELAEIYDAYHSALGYKWSTKESQ